MSAGEPDATDRRYEIDPDPAWDAYDEADGVLVVELSWLPDALAGRPPEIVAAPELVAALAAAGLTGYRTGPARGHFGAQVIGVEPATAPPPLARLLVGDDPAADFAYEHSRGLTVSARALAVLRAHCDHLTVTPVG